MNILFNDIQSTIRIIITKINYVGKIFLFALSLRIKRSFFNLILFIYVIYQGFYKMISESLYMT